MAATGTRGSRGVYRMFPPEQNMQLRIPPTEQNMQLRIPPTPVHFLTQRVCCFERVIGRRGLAATLGLSLIHI